MTVPAIERDRYCKCGYNLRGLTFDHHCPECGMPVVESIRLIVGDPKPCTPEQAQMLEKGRELLNLAAQDSPFPREAFLFVAKSVRYAVILAKGPEVTSRDICRAFRDLAKYMLGGPNKATLTLADWGFTGSEDVGEVLFRMVETGRIQVSEGDSVEQFNDVFTLDNLFAVEI